MGPRPPCAYPNPWMTIYIRANEKKSKYITHNDSESALLTAIENTADSLSGSNSFARESTAKLERYKTLSNVSSYLLITSMIPRASSSSSNGLQLQHNTASSISDRSNVLMAYLEDKREDVHEILHGLVAKYQQDDIFACDVTELAFRRSPMVLDTRLAWERAVNCEFINTVLWMLGSANMCCVLVAAAIILPVWWNAGVVVSNLKGILNLHKACNMYWGLWWPINWNNKHIVSWR